MSRRYGHGSFCGHPIRLFLLESQSAASAGAAEPIALRHTRRARAQIRDARRPSTRRPVTKQILKASARAAPIPKNTWSGCCNCGLPAGLEPGATDSAPEELDEGLEEERQERRDRRSRRGDGADRAERRERRRRREGAGATA